MATRSAVEPAPFGSPRPVVRPLSSSRLDHVAFAGFVVTSDAHLDAIQSVGLRVEVQAGAPSVTPDALGAARAAIASAERKLLLEAARRGN